MQTRIRRLSLPGTLQQAAPCGAQGWQHNTLDVRDFRHADRRRPSTPEPHHRDRCDAAATKIGNSVDPYLDVQRGKGTYSIDLGKYEQLAKNQPGSKIDPVFELLETTITHEARTEMETLDVKEHKVFAADKEVRTKKEAKEHMVFFRFKLEAGTDLSDFGMALVFDNLGDYEHHCSLVRETPRGKKQALKWTMIDQVHPHFVCASTN